MKGELGEVIKDCEKMIYKLASNYSMYYSMEDLYQAGVVGLIKAYKKYDFYMNKYKPFARKLMSNKLVEKVHSFIK